MLKSIIRRYAERLIRRLGYRWLLFYFDWWEILLLPVATVWIIAGERVARWRLLPRHIVHALWEWTAYVRLPDSYMRMSAHDQAVWKSMHPPCRCCTCCER